MLKYVVATRVLPLKRSYHHVLASIIGTDDHNSYGTLGKEFLAHYIECSDKLLDKTSW